MVRKRAYKRPLPRPTAAELSLLRVLWRLGPSTVREIHEQVAAQRRTGYTTTLKLLQRMADKGLVARDESRRKHVYRAALQEDATQRQLVRELLRGAFGGSPGRLVVQALSEQPASPEELREIRRILDELEVQSRKRGTK